MEEMKKEETKTESRFDHSKDQVIEACGIEPEKVKEVLDHMSDEITKLDRKYFRISYAIEILYKLCLEDKEALLIACYFAQPEIKKTISKVATKSLPIDEDGIDKIVEATVKGFVDKLIEQLEGKLEEKEKEESK